MPISSYEKAKAKRELEEERRAARFRREQMKALRELALSEAGAAEEEDLPDTEEGGAEERGVPPVAEKETDRRSQEQRRLREFAKEQAKRRLEKRRVVEAGAKKAAKKEVKATAGRIAKFAVTRGGASGAAAAAEAGGAAAGATAPVWGTGLLIALAVIIVAALLIALVLGTIIVTCNSGGLSGFSARAASKIGAFFGVLPGDICGSFVITPGGGLGSSSVAGAFNNNPSPELSVFMNCMNVVLPTLTDKRVGSEVGRITSITDSNIAAGLCNPLDPGEIFNNAANCQHAQNSCHYGGRDEVCQGRGSYAVDYGDEENFEILKNAAQVCSERLVFPSPATVIYESDHVHISIGAAYNCGCN